MWLANCSGKPGTVARYSKKLREVLCALWKGGWAGLDCLFPSSAMYWGMALRAGKT